MSDSQQPLVQALTTPTADAPPTGDAMILAPNENRVYRVPVSQVSAYEQRGFRRYSGPTIDDNGLNATMQSWGRSAEAAGLGALNNLPFVSAGIGKFAPDDLAHDYAASIAQAKQQHPLAYGLGAAGGTLGSIAAGGAAFKLAGAGASALAGGAARLAAPAAEAFLPGLGEALTGAAGAEGAATAAGAAGAAGEAGFFSANTAAQVAKGATEGGFYAGLQSTSDQAGDAALSHALSPEGKEQLSFSFNRLAMDAAIGAVAGGALRGAGLAGKAAVKTGGEKGKMWLRRSVLPEEGESVLRKQAKFSGQEAAYKTEQEAKYGAHNLEGDMGFVPETIKRADDLALRAQAGESPTKILADDAHKAGTTMADIRARAAGINVDPDTLEGVLNRLTKEVETSAVLGKELEPARQYIAAARLVKSGATDLTEAQRQAASFDTIDLQKMFSSIRANVNFRKPENHDIYRAMENAGKSLSSLENHHLGQELGPEYAEAMRGAKRDFSSVAAVADQMDAKSVTTIQDILKSGSSSGIANAFASAIGAKSLGIGRAAAQGAAFSVVGMAKSAAPYAGKRLMDLDKMRQNADGIFFKTLRAGLYGLAPTFNDMRHSGDYHEWAARALAAKAAPLENHANVMTGLTEAGLTDKVARPVALQLHGAMIDAANRLPPRQGPADMPTMSQPDAVVQRKWMAMTRSAMDPYYALRFPTAENMRMAKQYSPQTVAKAQQVILDQVTKNPALPATTRYYMSRVLGRPVSSASSPRFYQMLMQLRQQAEAEAAQGTPQSKPRPSGGQSAGVASEATQLQQISE